MRINRILIIFYTCLFVFKVTYLYLNFNSQSENENSDLELLSRRRLFGLMTSSQYTTRPTYVLVKRPLKPRNYTVNPGTNYVAVVTAWLNEPLYLRPICNGNIIGPYFIVTVAECMYKPHNKKEVIRKDTMKVLVGMTTEDSAMIFEVEDYQIHPKYSGGYKHNIALIFITRFLPCDSDYIKPIAVADIAVNLNDGCFVNGVGDKFFDPEGPVYLKSYEITPLKCTKCERLIKKYNADFHVCGAEKTGAVASGGPVERGSGLVCRTALVGMVSFFSKTYTIGAKYSFVPIYPYCSWIKEMARKAKVPPAPKLTVVHELPQPRA